MNIKKPFSNKNIFIFNTFLVLISGFVVKILGLINKIFITRLLGTEGMALYVLAFPTIILFINLSSFSLNVTTSKLVSEAVSYKIYSPQKIIQSAKKLAIKTAIIVEIIFLSFLYLLTHFLLKTPDLFYPLLMTAFLIPLVGITDTYRGIFSGLQMMNIVAKVNIIEQITRIIFSICGIILFSKYGIIIAVSFTTLALSIGEGSSLIYLIFKSRKITFENYDSANNEKKVVWNMAFPTTLSRLIGSFTYFFEPILYTTILLKLNYSKTSIDYDYTIINAYIIPLLTICTFLSSALSTTAIPSIAEKSKNENRISTIKLINKIFILALIPGVIVSILLYLFPKEYLNLLFSTTEGYSYIKKYVFLFLVHYFQSPGIAILQALGLSKSVLSICSFYNVLKLFLIVVLSFIPNIGSFSLFYAVLVVLILETLTIWFKIYKETTFKPNAQFLVNLFIIIIFILSIYKLLSIYVNNYIIVSVLLLIMYLTLITKFKIVKF